MRLTHIFLVSLVVVIWGGNFVVIRWGVEDVDPYIMTAFRFLLTAVPVIFFVKKPNIKLSILAIHGILFGGGLWGIVNYAIFLGTPSGLASLVLQASAFLSVIAAVVIFKEEITKNKFIGITLALIGFLLIIYSSYESEQSIRFYGIVLVLIAALSWTICNMIIKKYKPDNVIGFISWSSLFVPMPILLLSYLDNPNNFISSLTTIGFQGYVSITFQAFVTTLFGYSIWTYFINKYGLAVIAPYSLIVPISGIFFAWIIYNEKLTHIEIAGSIIVLVGLVVNSGLVRIYKK